MIENSLSKKIKLFKQIGGVSLDHSQSILLNKAYNLGILVPIFIIKMAKLKESIGIL